MDTKTICVVVALGRKYHKLGHTAARSFTKWHPDIDLYLITERELPKFPWFDPERAPPPGVAKFLATASMWSSYEEVHGCKARCIILGADTVTCARLDEFLDDTTTDVLCSLDYPYPLHYGNKLIAPANRHVNADVVCFNSMMALKTVINSAHLHEQYHEQGALNELINNPTSGVTSVVVDDYETSSVIYNARAKGNQVGSTLQPIDYTSKFWVEGDKLYTPAFKDGVPQSNTRKQIKVWHHAQGFGHCGEETMKSELNLWANERFPCEVRRFFVDHCNAGIFFNQPFTF